MKWRGELALKEAQELLPKSMNELPCLVVIECGRPRQGKCDQKSQAVSRATGNSLKAKKWAVLVNRSTTTRMAAFPCEGACPLWNLEARATTAGQVWRGSLRATGAFADTFGVGTGLRLGCNQLYLPTLWATSLPVWSGSVSSSSHHTQLQVHQCLQWSSSNVWLLAPLWIAIFFFASRGMEKREAADPVSAVRVLTTCHNSSLSLFTGLIFHWAN